MASKDFVSDLLQLRVTANKYQTICSYIRQSRQVMTQPLVFFWSHGMVNKTCDCTDIRKSPCVEKGSENQKCSIFNLFIPHLRKQWNRSCQKLVCVKCDLPFHILKEAVCSWYHGPRTAPRWLPKLSSAREGRSWPRSALMRRWERLGGGRVKCGGLA